MDEKMVGPKKARIVIPDNIPKNLSWIVSELLSKNMDGSITYVNMDEFKNSESSICLYGQGFTVGFIPKEWLSLDTDHK